MDENEQNRFRFRFHRCLNRILKFPCLALSHKTLNIAWNMILSAPTISFTSMMKLRLNLFLKTGKIISGRSIEHNSFMLICGIVCEIFCFLLARTNDVDDEKNLGHKFHFPSWKFRFFYVTTLKFLSQIFHAHAYRRSLNHPQVCALCSILIFIIHCATFSCQTVGFSVFFLPRFDEEKSFQIRKSSLS